jgi:hypothetical protein
VYSLKADKSWDALHEVYQYMVQLYATPVHTVNGELVERVHEGFKPLDIFLTEQVAESMIMVFQKYKVSFNISPHHPHEYTYLLMFLEY